MTLNEVTDSAQVETPQAFADRGDKTQPADVQRWKAEIERALSHAKGYHTASAEIMRRYRSEVMGQKSGQSRRHYNVLWSMTNTLMPNLFMGMPKPFVSRRYRDKDPVARAASLILERALIYVNDSDEMHDAFASAVDDYILSARGTVWTRYMPEFDLRHSEQKTRYNDAKSVPEGAKLGEDKEGKFYRAQVRKLSNEECETDHVGITGFLHPACSNWKNLPWVAKRVLMTRRELVERFGKKIGPRVPLLYSLDGERTEKKENAPAEAEALFKTALVWEIWDKSERRVLWLCPDHDEMLDERDDPLKLRNFFPCPKPLYGTRTNNTLIPVPDFILYQSLASELDDLTRRISLLTSAIRVVGVYDSQLGDLIKRLTTETMENDMIPVSNFQALSDGGGLKKVVDFLPVENLIVVLEKLYEARKALLAELYDITGMSDIIRGTSDPRETAAAQKIKGNYASKRLVRRQKDVARFAREHLEIQAEIICAHYEDETIFKISNAESICVDQNGQYRPDIFEAAIKLLRNNPLRHFRIKIDNDTLAGDDITADRELGVQFMTSMSQLISGVIPMAQQAPQLGRVLKELVLFGVRLFPIARSVEGQLEQALEDLANNPPKPEQEAGAKGPAPMSPEEVALKKQELAIRERELGLKLREFTLKDYEVRSRIEIDKQRLLIDASLREKQIDSQAQTATAQISQKDRSDDKKVGIERDRMVNDNTQAAHDREHASREADKQHMVNVLSEREGRAHEAGEGAKQRDHDLEISAADIAERRMDRDAAGDDAKASREQADKHHTAKLASEERKANAKARAKPKPSKQ